jgi:phage shock protein PspC (stress-responsive transcriptional regulator)
MSENGTSPMSENEERPFPTKVTNKRIAEEVRRQLIDHAKYKAYDITSSVVTVTWFIAAAVTICAFIVMTGFILAGRFDGIEYELDFHNIEGIKKYKMNVDRVFLNTFRSFMTLILSLFYMFIMYLIGDWLAEQREIYKSRRNNSFLLE